MFCVGVCVCVPLLYPIQFQHAYNYLAEKFGAEISLIFCKEAVQNLQLATAFHMLESLDDDTTFLVCISFFSIMAYICYSYRIVVSGLRVVHEWEWLRFYRA